MNTSLENGTKRGEKFPRPEKIQCKSYILGSVMQNYQSAALRHNVWNWWNVVLDIIIGVILYAIGNDICNRLNQKNNKVNKWVGTLYSTFCFEIIIWLSHSWTLQQIESTFYLHNFFFFYRCPSYIPSVLKSTFCSENCGMPWIGTLTAALR